MSATRRIPPAEWEAHKHRIIELYLSQGLTLSGRPGRDGVVETMEREGFVATKSQYEAKLRGWGVRKNMTLEDWKRHAPDIRESRQRGELPSIQVSGRPVSNSKIAKAWRRYRLGGNPAAERDTRDHDLTALGSEVPSVLADGRQSLIDESVSEAENLPSLGATDAAVDTSIYQRGNGFGFNIPDYNVNNAGVNPLANFTYQGQAGSELATEMNMLSSSLFGLDEVYPLDNFFGGPIGTVGMNHAPSLSTNVLSSNTSTQLATYTCSSTTLPDSSRVTLKRKVIFPRERWIGPLPSAKIIFMAGKGLYGTGLTASTHNSVLGVARFHLVNQFFSDVTRVVSQDINQTRPPILSYSTILICLASEEKFVGEEESQFAVLSSDDAFESRFYSRLIRSVMNGFAGLDNISTSGALRFLNRQSHSHSFLLEFLRSGPRPEAKSLAENIFQAALEADDVDITRLMLNLGLVDVNDAVCLYRGQRYTPLGIAAQKKSIKALKLLLGFNVDINKSFTKSQLRYTPGGDTYPLDYLICGDNYPIVTSEQNILDLAKDFLKARATISVLSISFALDRFADMRLANILLDTFADQIPLQLIEETFIIPIFEHLKEDDATRIIKHIIEKCQEHDDKFLYQFQKQLGSALDNALEYGNTELISLLLPHSFSLDGPFRRAIEIGNQEVIDIVLKGNPDLDKNIDGITPLAAALRSGNQKLVILLEEKGVLNRMGESELDLAITAALEAGDLVYATKLIDLNADAHVDRLVRALNAAIIHDYDDVVWRLLAAGANVAATSNEGISPLYTAAKKRKLNLVRTMLECNLDPVSISYGIHDEGQSTSFIEALVDMGDHKIVTDLLQLYGCESKPFQRGFTTSVPPTPSNPLERALEKADQDTFWVIIKSSSQRTRRDSLSYALKIAVRREDPSLLYSLFGFGANPDDEDALSLAVMEHPSMVEPLLKRFREVYPNGRSGYGVTAMSRVLSQHPILSEGLSALLNSKLVDEKELSYENIHGQSLLSLAFNGRIDERGIRHVDIDLIKMLLEAGSNPNSVSTRIHYVPRPATVRDWTTESVLLDAISTRNIKLVSLLIERGARVNEPTRLGMRRTPLQKAAEVGSLEIIRLLLEKGADINAAAAGRYGGTALQFAAIVGDCTMATELIEHGARFDVRPSWGNEGRWPLEGAAENGRIDMIQLLWYANSGNFDEKQCQKAMKLAERNGHIGCRDKIAELMSTSWVPAIEHPTESQGGPLDIVWGEGGLSMFG